MSVLGRNWRVLAIPIAFASLVRGKTGWIRKPPLYPLKYGNSEICNFKFSSASCTRRTPCWDQHRRGLPAQVMCGRQLQADTTPLSEAGRDCRELFERMLQTPFAHFGAPQSQIKR